MRTKIETDQVWICVGFRPCTSDGCRATLEEPTQAYGEPLEARLDPEQAAGATMQRLGSWIASGSCGHVSSRIACPHVTATRTVLSPCTWLSRCPQGDQGLKKRERDDPLIRRTPSLCTCHA